MSSLSLNTSFAVEPLSISYCSSKSIELSIARLDLLHPVISGNKLYKLAPYESLLPENCDTMVTMGGPYSNHLVATAFFCTSRNLRSIGFVRGEKPPILSPTLLQCMEYGMHLIYLERDKYRRVDQSNYKEFLPSSAHQMFFVNEGGFGSPGSDGASVIMKNLMHYAPTHVATAVGTATTLAGLLKTADTKTKVMGFPVLKGMTDIPSRIDHLLSGQQHATPQIIPEYHFGGYAKYDDMLIGFMNDFYLRHRIPLDFVYTGKMMFGLMDLIQQDYFPEGSRIIALHTGGLQGNLSLRKDLLDF